MSNFVFPRRSLQQSIDRLAPTLNGEQLASLVARLNRLDDQRLPAMWELVMLDALAAVGVLRHEIQLPNGRRPDIELTVTPEKGAPFMIVGDVATVSDSGLDEQNPVNHLSIELNRLVTKAGLKSNHFRYDVRGSRDGPHGDSRIKLLLPVKSELFALMKKEVVPWIGHIKAAPCEVHCLNITRTDADFSLTYDPTQCFGGGGYQSYDVAASRDKNPLFRALKGKLGQLRHAPPAALRLIIACDGDCALLRQSSLARSAGNFSAREVAEDFLRKNSSIDAVLLATIDEQQHMFSPTPTYRMRYDLAIAPSQVRSSRMTPTSIAALEAVLREGMIRIPQPVRSAYNAVVLCRTQNFGPDMIGGYKMDHSGISLSSRALQRLLAGEISANDFFKAYGWANDSSGGNPFARAIASGQLISKVEIRSADENDDAWVTFSFGLPDPAIAPFCVPE